MENMHLFFPPEQHLKDLLPVFFKGLLKKTFNYIRIY